MQSSLRLTALLCLLMALPDGSARASTTSQGDPMFSGTYLAGRSAGRLRDLDAASAFVGRALQLDPENVSLIERLFVLDLSAGKIAEAETLAERVISFNSEHRMALTVLGLKALREGKPDDARAHFNESAYTPVGELSARLLLAWTAASKKDLNGAFAELAKLGNNDTFTAFKSFHEALIADFLNSPLRAQTAYKAAFDASGPSLRVTQAFSSFLRRNGKASEAERICREFLSKNGPNVLIEKELADIAAKAPPGRFVTSVLDGAGEALFSLAAAMNEGDSVEVALAYAQLAVSTNSDQPVMLTMLGDIQADMSRAQAAIDVYGRVAEDSPLRPNADMQIGLNLQRLGDTAKSVEHLKRLLEKSPNYTNGWQTLGNVYRANEQYAEAHDAYSRAIALFDASDKDNWQIFYYRGITLERMKRWPEAEADFRKALSISPEEASVLNYLGYTLIDRKEKLDEAIKMVKQAVELRPNDGYIIDSLGWAYYQLGQYEEAVGHLERAVELKAGDPIIAEHLGDAYWKVGRTLEAKFQWQHAKDNKPEPEDLKRIEDKLKNGLVEPEPPKAEAPKG